jgi:tetratricopeptide (TPR) repeat protein
MKRHRRTTTAQLTAAAALAALSSIAPAAAQPARDPAMAEALFNRAKALLDQGDWAGACAKFNASMELDPAVSTALKIARCHEHEGKIALALGSAEAALKLNATSPQPESRRRDLAAYAEKLLADLAPRVPRIRLLLAVVPSGLRLAYDGRALPVDALGELLPIDPGQHAITAEAEGYLPLQRLVTLAEGQALDVDLALIPRPAPLASPPPPPPLAPTAITAAPAAAPLAPRIAGAASARRTAGLGVAVLGVATLGAAGVLGLLTRGKVSDAAPYCAQDFSSCFDARGLARLDQARDLQTAAFVLLGVGAVAAGTGAALFFTAPRDLPRLGAR